MTDTTVKFFHSEMPGAPVLSGTPGSLIAVLDAVLVNGFGLKTIDSLVIAANVATANISTGHSAEVGSVVLIAGATPAALNGEQKVTATSATSVTFATVGIPDQTATGAISLKMASAGWSKTFSDTNKAVYKSNDPTGTGVYLRVDDTSDKYANAVGYEMMTDMNSGTGRFPSVAQLPNGVFWSKSDTASSASRKWVIAVDTRLITHARYYAQNSYPLGCALHCFGDPVPNKVGDAFSAVLMGDMQDASSNAPGNGNATENLYLTLPSDAPMYSPRSYTGLGSSISNKKGFTSLNYQNYWVSGICDSPPFPNPCDGGLFVTPLLIHESLSKTFRSVLPGIYGCPQNIPVSVFATKDAVVGVSGLPGKILRVLTCNYTTPYGVVFLDSTGPWR